MGHLSGYPFKTPSEKVGGGGGYRESDEEKRRREQRQHLMAAKEQRIAHIRELLAKKKAPLPRVDAVKLFVASLIDGLDGCAYGQQAAAWLGVFPPIDLRETTFSRAGALHVVVDEKENKEGATIITAACGFRGLGAGISRPDDRDNDPEPSELCPGCLDHCSSAGYHEYEDAIREILADANEATLLRVGVAVALAWQEDDGWRGPEPGYLRLLEQTGYTLSDAEQTHIAEQQERA